jgi:hypothetical protein
MADHVELALRCGGAVAPVADAGHMPFLERPTETVRWIEAAARLATHEANGSAAPLHDASTRS